jgi:RHS repeat-associated protein
MSRSSHAWRASAALLLFAAMGSVVELCAAARSTPLVDSAASAAIDLATVCLAPDTLVRLGTKGASSLDAMRVRRATKTISDLRLGDEGLALAEWQESALIARYSYDPFDRRIRKQLGDSATLATAGLVSNSITHTLQSEWGPLAEADATGTVQVSYGWSPQRDAGVAPLYARVPNPAAPGSHRYVYYHNDHLGTPQRITNKAGAVVWAADYDAYGKATVRTTADASLALASYLRLPGQYFDPETGLHYNDRRYYDPDTGRYTSRDPIGFEGGINLYAYAGAAPNRYTDPTDEIIPCLLANYARCNIMCNIESAAGDLMGGNCGGGVNWGKNATDCLQSCLWSLLPMPDPCGKFGKLVSLALGLAAGMDNSFAPDTLVHVRPQGASSLDAMRGRSETKAIKDLRPGDEVLALAEWQEPGKLQTDSGDKLDQRLSYQKVSDMVTSTREQRVVHVTLDDGQTIEATDGHPFKTTDGWRDAILLKKGGKLLLKGRGDAESEGKRAAGRSGVEQLAIAVVANKAAPAALSAPHERSATIVDVRIEIKTLPVFNIEVANAHTFFVGEEGVLVHNAKCGSGSFPIARRVNLSSKKDAYEKAKRAGRGAEPILHPADFHGNPTPHYHPDVSMPKEWTPKGPNPHDHYNFPRGK